VVAVVDHLGPTRGSARDPDYCSGKRTERYLSFVNIELPSSEHVLWSGSPVRYPVFDRQDAVLVPVSILWFGFAIFWETTAVQMAAPFFFEVWGVPFLVIGFYMSIGRLIVRQVMLRSAVYTVTNLRIIMQWNGLANERERSRYLDHLEPPILAESDDGVGTIRFGSASPFQFNLQQRRGWLGQDLFVLYAIPNARSVRDIILTART